MSALPPIAACQMSIVLWKQSHSPGRYIVYRPDKLHTALGHSRLAFGRLEDLTHGQADVGFNSAFKPLRRRKLRVDIIKPWEHFLQQQLDARTCPEALELGGERRPHRAAACVSQHHEQLRPEVYACVLEAAPDLRGNNV